MNGSLHPRENVGRLCVAKKEGGRELIITSNKRRNITIKQNGIMRSKSH